MINLEIENIVIQKLVEEPQMSEMIKESYFDLPIAKYIYRKIKERFLSDATFYESAIISAELACKEYKMLDIFQFINGNGYAHIESAEYYATILKERYFKKKIKHKLIKYLQRIEEPNSEFFSIFKEMEEQKAEIENTIEVENPSLQENLNDAVKEMYIRRQKHESGVIDYTTNFKDFDEIVTPEKGNIMIVAARPSVGKTSLINNFAKNYSLNGEIGLYFSLEVSKLSLTNRFLLSENSSVDSEAFKKGYIDNNDCRIIEESLPVFNEMNIEIIDNKFHIDDIIQNIDQRCRKVGVTYVIIDFVQIIQVSGNSENERMTFISQKLKACAKRNNILIIPLSQLNRGIEGRNSDRHLLSDLRGSGSFEQDGDIIIFLYRQAAVDIKEGLEVDWNDQEVRNIQLQILKNKNGSIGDVKLYHNKTVTKFYDTKVMEETKINDEFDNLVIDNSDPF
jgi:replicative DNA helicase